MSHREHRSHLHDLLRVGDAKPLGYLPLGTLESLAGVSRAAVARWCRRRRLTYAFFTENECNVLNGAVYVCSLPALERLLKAHSTILEKSGWPQEPRAFMHAVATRFAHNRKVYALVGRAFADQRFPDDHPLLNTTATTRTRSTRRRPG